MTEGLPDLMTGEDVGGAGDKPIVHRRGGRPLEPDDQAKGTASSETDPDDDGPVAFRQSRPGGGGEEPGAGEDQRREVS